MANIDTMGAQFDFSRVTARIVSLIRRNFFPFFVLALIFAGLPTVIVEMMSGSSGFEPPSYLLLSVFLSLVTGVFLQGVLTRASIDDLSGKPVSIGAALNHAAQMFLPLIGLALLVAIALVAGLILLIVPGLALAVRWSVAGPSLIVEKTGVLDAMGRSAKLTENHRWAIFGLLLLYGALALVVTIISTLIVSNLLGGMISFTITTAIQAFLSMISTVGVASVYFELRQIKEGVGVAELASVFD
jgi:hypothetical protein